MPGMIKIFIEHAPLNGDELFLSWNLEGLRKNKMAITRGWSRKCLLLTVWKYNSEVFSVTMNED